MVRGDGVVLGEIESVSVKLVCPNCGQSLGVGVEAVDVDQSQLPTPTPKPEQTALMPNPLTEVWQHYQATVHGADRRKLDSQRQTCIRRALKVRTVDECCKAIDSLAASDWHNGDNPEHKRYLDIQYALGQKSESADRRIDTMIERLHEAPPSRPNGPMTVDQFVERFAPDLHSRLRAAIEAIEQMAQHPDDSNAELQGTVAVRRLTGSGYRPVVEDGKVVSIEVV